MRFIHHLIYCKRSFLCQSHVELMVFADWGFPVAWCEALSSRCDLWRQSSDTCLPRHSCFTLVCRNSVTTECRHVTGYASLQEQWEAGWMLTSLWIGIVFLSTQYAGRRAHTHMRHTSQSPLPRKHIPAETPLPPSVCLSHPPHSPHSSPWPPFVPPSTPLLFCVSNNKKPAVPCSVLKYQRLSMAHLTPLHWDNGTFSMREVTGHITGEKWAKSHLCRVCVELYSQRSSLRIFFQLKD